MKNIKKNDRQHNLWRALEWNNRLLQLVVGAGDNFDNCKCKVLRSWCLQGKARREMFWEHCQRGNNGGRWGQRKPEVGLLGSCRPNYKLGTLLEATHKKGMFRAPKRAETWLSPQLIQQCLTCKGINKYFLHWWVHLRSSSDAQALKCFLSCQAPSLKRQGVESIPLTLPGHWARLTPPLRYILHLSLQPWDICF